MVLSNSVIDTVFRGLPVPEETVVLYYPKEGVFPTSYTLIKDGVRARRSTNLYNCWTNMSQRCLEGSSQQLKIKSYEGCINNFNNYQEFAEFCYNLPFFTYLDEFGKPYEIDKDIKGFLSNKSGLYSKDTICMLPKDINCFLTCVQKHGENIMRSTQGVIQRIGKTAYQVRTQDVCGDRKRKVMFVCEDYNLAYSYLKELKKKQAKFLAAKFKGKVEDCVIDFLNSFDLDVWENWTYQKWENKRGVK